MQSAYNTIFARHRQGSDGAAEVGDEDTHGSIVEFEEPWLQVLIRHWILSHWRTLPVRGSLYKKRNQIPYDVSNVGHVAQMTSSLSDLS